MSLQDLHSFVQQTALCQPLGLPTKASTTKSKPIWTPATKYDLLTDSNWYYTIKLRVLTLIPTLVAKSDWKGDLFTCLQSKEYEPSRLRPYLTGSVELSESIRSSVFL